MRHRSIFHHLKLLVVVCTGLTVGILAGGVYYVNQTGINDQWRQRIALELENLGIIADFESLRFEITKGLVANGVRIYADSQRDEVIARLEHLVIDVDKTKLMRGKIRVLNIALKQADIDLPVDPDMPDGPRITVDDLRGEMFLPNKSTIEARSIEGRLAGIHISMDARLWSEKSIQGLTADNVKEQRLQRRKFVATVLEEIGKWDWPEKTPPNLKLYVETNTNSPKTARIDFIFEAPEIERNGLTLYDVKVSGDYNNSILTLDMIRLRDNAGQLQSQAAYLPATRTAKFEAQSTLHIQRVFRQLFGLRVMNQFTYSTPPSVSCVGTAQFRSGTMPITAVTGHISMKGFSFLGSRFSELETDFSSQDKDVFLTQLYAIHDEGELKGRVLLKDEIIQYEADSTLPASSYKPFLKASGIGEALEHAEFKPASSIHIITRGTMNRKNFTQWEAAGYAKIDNFSFKDTAMNSLSGHYQLSELHSNFTDIKADFNYDNYPLKITYGGPSNSSVTASSIFLSRDEGIVKLDNISGTAWPAPIVRLFVPEVAEHVEKYRFHRPPNLSASGTFGLNENYKTSDFNIKLSCPGSLHYDFLNEPLELSRLSSNVRILGDRVDVSDLSFTAFEGLCSGSIRAFTSQPENAKYLGELQFRRLHLKGIGELYKFENVERGLLTGRIDFRGEGDQISKFNAEGSIALEKGNLFAVPLLGPVSTLVGTVLRDKNPTEETAKDASCTYVIRDGVAFSNDFLATTRSLKFTGEGSIDLDKKEIDLLMRMNARGIFGFIAMPLRPFMGLFQFKGTGSISEPIWKTTMFTTPSGGQENPIFRKPPKADVITE